jgi:hypothetical protein
MIPSCATADKLQSTGIEGNDELEQPLEAVRSAVREEAWYEALGPVDRMICLSDRGCRTRNDT